MKALLALGLLCFFVFMVEAGHEQGAEERDPCTRAVDAISYFMEMRSCIDKRTLNRIFRQLRRVLTSNNLTVDSLQNVFSSYCSTVFPARVQCFRGHLQSCPDDQKTYLTGMLERTGFLCEPNTSNAHPYFSNLIQSLTDEELQLGEDCFTDNLHEIGENCYENVMASFGMTSREFKNFIKNATVQEFIPYVPRILNPIFECNVRMIREQPNRCAQWRGLALKFATVTMFHFEILGNTMTITQSQLLQMFELVELQNEGAMETLKSAFLGN